MRRYFVYILASENNNVLYIGITNNLVRRVCEHKAHKNKGFTAEYHVTKLVYYEEYFYVRNAIEREKKLKKWNRVWKDELINNVNPLRRDLFNTL